jgi:hypothetical protein
VSRRYFTESCKKITTFCHNHQRLDRRVLSRLYFIESCKKLTALCHNHRRLYRRIVSCRYFTNSYKTITALATIIDEFTDEISDGWCTFQCGRLLDCLVGRHSYRRHHLGTRQIQCARALTPFYRRMCWRILKNLEGFSKF